MKKYPKLSKYERLENNIKCKVLTKVDQAIEFLLECKRKYPDWSLEIEYDTYDYYGSTSLDVHLYGTRAESDAEYAERLAVIKANQSIKRKQKSEEKKKKEDEEKALYLKLKEKYENG